MFGTESWVVSLWIGSTLGGFQSQGGPAYGKDASEEGRDGQLYLSTAGRGNEGSVYGVGLGVIPPPP